MHLGALPISMIAIKLITQLFDFNLQGKELIRSESEDIVLEEALFLVLRFLQPSTFFIFPFLFLNEVSENMVLTRSEVHLRQRRVRILVPQVNVVEDQLWIQHQRHIAAFGSSGPGLPVSDDLASSSSSTSSSSEGT